MLLINRPIRMTMTLLSKVVGLTSVGALLASGLAQTPLVWLVTKLVESMMPGTRLIISCVQSLTQARTVLTLSKLLLSNRSTCRSRALVKEKLSPWVTLCLNRLRRLECLMSGTTTRKLRSPVGLVPVSECERKLVRPRPPFLSIMWLLGKTNVLSVVITPLAGNIILLVKFPINLSCCRPLSCCCAYCVPGETAAATIILWACRCGSYSRSAGRGALTK